MTPRKPLSLETRKHISEAQKKLGNKHWTKRPEVRAKISETLKRRYAAGEIVAVTPDRADAGSARRGVKLPKKQRAIISEKVKRAWAEGRYTNRKHHRRTGKPSLVEEIIAPKLLELGFTQQFPLLNKKSGHYFRFDFGHRECKVLVEIDGDDHRSTLSGRLSDRTKQRVADMQGYEILHFTNKAVKFDPGSVVALIRLHVT